MLRPLAIAGGLLLGACAGASGWSQRAAETGTVLMAISADGNTARSLRAFDLGFRRIDRSVATDFSYTVRGMDADHSDFRTQSETGVVLQKRLPAGEYEVTELVGDRGSFWWAKETRPSQPIALHFVVAAGDTTYIGHFRVGLDDTPGQPALTLSVSDDNAADVMRARSKFRRLGGITVAVAGDADGAGPGAQSGALATP